MKSKIFRVFKNKMKVHLNVTDHLISNKYINLTSMTDKKINILEVWDCKNFMFIVMEPTFGNEVTLCFLCSSTCSLQ